eukprot:m.47350 g.47350  ORF g.47350 m.47350 type:complete len:66 (-) comp6877_c0_seq1:817-1014(-)
MCSKYNTFYIQWQTSGGVVPPSSRRSIAGTLAVSTRDDAGVVAWSHCGRYRTFRESNSTRESDPR